jgi:hypothetical protein
VPDGYTLLLNDCFVKVVQISDNDDDKNDNDFDGDDNYGNGGRL